MNLYRISIAVAIGIFVGPGENDETYNQMKSLEPTLDDFKEMQAEWDAYTLSRLGVSYTQLFFSRRQARSGNVMSFDDLLAKLDKTE